MSNPNTILNAGKILQRHVAQVLPLQFIKALILLIPGFINWVAIGQERKCDYSASARAKSLASTRLETNDPVLYVPVVIHIVYSTEEQNISYGQILSQLNALNHDFRRTSADTVITLPLFKDLASDTKIEFFLAEEVGSPEKGVLRIPTSHGPFHGSDIHQSEAGGSDAIDTKLFLNIWVAELAGEVFGYSRYESGAPLSEEGIVIDFRYFGTMGTVSAPFDKGRTLTHEAGHWLGLAHPWGAEGCGDGDGIADTPWQESPSFGCNLNKETCGSPDMVQNFMDLSDDNCMNLFTAGQANLMRTTLLTQKAGLAREGILLSTNKSLSGTEVSIYPNPTRGTFTIRHNPEVFTRLIQVTDETGKGVGFNVYYEKNMIRVDPIEKQSGLIFLEIQSNSIFRTKRVILN